MVSIILIAVLLVAVGFLIYKKTAQAGKIHCRRKNGEIHDCKKSA